MLVRFKRRVLFNIVMVIVLFFAGIWSFEYVDAFVLNYSLNNARQAPQGKISIKVDVLGRTLELYDDGKLHKRYRIAVGKKATPTPVGEWFIVYKSYSPKEMFGTRWMGLDVPWGSYGIHGTNVPWSIGYFASHGCIRLRNQDVEELYELVPIGTQVVVKGPMHPIERVLGRNAVGPDVVTLQFKLIETGYYQGRADGKFGWETEAALRAFQRDNRLEENGVLDEKTRKKLRL